MTFTENQQIRAIQRTLDNSRVQTITQIFNIKDFHGAQFHKVISILANLLLVDTNIRLHAVEGGTNRGPKTIRKGEEGLPFGVILTNTLGSIHININLLQNQNHGREIPDQVPTSSE